MPTYKTTILLTLGSLDLTCFALVNLNYGDVWGFTGGAGLVLLLAVFEFV